MDDPTTDGGGPVFRLIYRSHSLIAPEGRGSVLGEIFTTARRNNRRVGVTGALLLSGDAFVQALEGDREVVRGLYATIERDSRHTDLAVLEELVVPGRTFGRWAMARVAEDGGADLRLLSNADRGVIVAASRPDPSITPAQEDVLATMRGALVLDALEG